MTRIQSIRQRIIDRDYYLSSRAEDEMLADDIEREDVENAIKKGVIERRLIRDPRGTRYRIEGPARMEGLYMWSVDSVRTMALSSLQHTF